MSEQQTSYRQIMKATSLFGGVQVFQILIQIIRSKVVAVLLGPAGMGIVGLLTSTLGLVGGITNFGLGTSAVKNIAEAVGTENEMRIATIIKVLRRLVWVTGLLGACITLIFSSWLSQLTFGNTDYTLAFIWLSVTLLLNQLSSGQMVLLQGLRKLNALAKANLLGSSIGLLFTIPLYYKWGADAIVPVIIITSTIALLLSFYFSRKIKIVPVKVSKVRTIAEGKNMLVMGFMISLSGLIGAASSYLIRIFISNHGTLVDVGLYSAGFTIIGTYVGLVFTAMGTDYYPRLSAVASDNKKARKQINEQAEIAILILAPILAGFLVFINWIIILLYSSKFLAINEMIHWAALGMYFKAASWSIAFVFLAKGDSKVFFWSELVANVYLLLLNIAGYYWLGLNGLGISFLLGYFIYLIQVFYIAKIKYTFSFDNEFLKIMLIQLTIGVFCFFNVKLFSAPYSYIVGSIFIISSLGYSYIELDKRMDINSLFINFKRKLND